MIACIKKRYKQKVAARAVDLIEGGELNNLYKVNIRQAGLWVYDIWARVENDVIFNCWVKSSLVEQVE